MTSQRAAETWPPGRKIGFAFIDGEHNREGLERDLDLWVPKMLNTGVLVVHDYHTATFPDVTTVLHERFGKELIFHPPGTQLAVISIQAYRKQKRKKTMGDTGPAKGPKSPPKGGPAQKSSKVKGGPAAKKGK